MSINAMNINTKFFYILYILFFSQMILYVIKKINNYDDVNSPMLWAAIILCIFIILLEIVSDCPYILITFQIIFFSFFLHLLFVPPVGLYDSDPLYDYHLIELISKYGWSLNLDSFLVPWPNIHIYICAASSLTGISLMDASRYLPSVICTLSLLFVFCLANFIFKNLIASNIAILLISITYIYIMFYSMPVRETLAVLILYLALYCYMCGTEKNDIRFVVLSVFAGLMLIMTHHFSVLIFMYYIIIHFLYWALVTFFIDISPSYKYKITYGLLILVAAIFYWLYVGTSVIDSFVAIFDSFVVFGEDIVKPFAHMDIYPSLTTNYPSILHAHAYSTKLTFITSIILIISVYKKGVYTRMQLHNYCLLSIVAFLSIIWLLGTYGLIAIAIYPERFLNHTWPLLLIFMGVRLYDIFMTNCFTWKKVVSICFIVSFIVMNISQLAMNSYLYDPTVEPPYVNGRMSLMHLPQEYSAFCWFKGLDVEGIIQSDRTTEDFLIHSNVNIKTSPDLFRGNLSHLVDSDWLIIRKEMHNIIIGARSDNIAIKKPLNLTKDVYNSMMSNYALNEIYDNNEVEICDIWCAAHHEIGVIDAD